MNKPLTDAKKQAMKDIKEDSVCNYVNAEEKIIVKSKEDGKVNR